MTRRCTIAAALMFSSRLAMPLQAEGEADQRVFAVNVIDREGNRVSGLEASNFRGEFRGQPVKILSVTDSTAPRRIAVLVDTSGSMHGREETLNVAWSAADDLVGSLASGHSVALFTVGAELRQHSGFTSERTTLQHAIAQARAEDGRGPSALYDGVVRAIQRFSSPAFGDVLYLISDGEDTASGMTDNDALSAAARSGVRVFVVSIPRRRREASQYRTAMSQADYWTRGIAEATGGRVLEQDRYGAAKAIKTRPLVYSLIARAYRLEVAFPRVVDKARNWNLEVLDGSGRTLRNVELIYPHLVAPRSVVMQVGAAGEGEVAPVRIGGNIAQPKLLRQVELQVPRLARDAGIVGQVGLHVTVGTDGRVRETNVMKGTPLLTEAAIEAVQQWQYEPLRLNGVPTPFTISVSFTVGCPEEARGQAITYILTNGSTELKESMCLLLAEPDEKPAFAGSGCRWGWKPYRSRLSKGDRKRVTATLQDMVQSEQSERVRSAAAKALERLVH